MSSVANAGLTREMFDFAGRMNVERRTAELEKRHEAYVGSHPELQMTLHDLMQSLLFHKPDDALGFIQKHFQDMRGQQNPKK
jgi:hypothetical protein